MKWFASTLEIGPTVLPQTTVSKFKLDPLEEAYIQTQGPRGVQRRQRFTIIANEKSFYLTNYCSLSQRLTAQESEDGTD